MKNKSKNNINTTSLLNAGIIKAKTTDATGVGRKHLVASYAPHELASNPNIKSKIEKVIAFLEDTKVLARKAKLKFSVRDFIVETLAKEVDVHTNK